MRSLTVRPVLLFACLLALAGCPGPGPGQVVDPGPVDSGTPFMLPDDGGAPVTYYRDVLPITQHACAGCHKEGGIAPFSLESYATAKPMASAMANATAIRRMPPWMPDSSCNRYTNELSLSTDQIDVMVRWAVQGAPEGNPADAPAPDTSRRSLDRVDQTLQMPQPYTPKANLVDDYHCFIIDPALTADRFVTAYEVSPGQQKEVHHVLLYTADKAAAMARDAQEAGDGYTCFGGPDVANVGGIGGWVPGLGAVVYPSGTGILLPAGQVLIMQVHYNLSSGAPTADQSHLKLQYANTPVTTAYLTPIYDATFAIPANAMGYTPLLPYQYTVPPYTNPTIYGLLPHMHTKGKRIEVRTPDQCLIDIPAWDFHWQQQYFLKTPFHATAGMQISLKCTWDNPTNRVVRWGEGTDDEMCLNYFYYTL